MTNSSIVKKKKPHIVLPCANNINEKNIIMD